MAPGTHSTYFRSQAEPSPALGSISTISVAVGSAVTSGSKVHPAAGAR